MTASQFPLPYQPTTIVGIDPGVSTGIAIATLWDNTSGTRTLHYNYFSATCTEPEQVWAYIRPPVDVVIMERFNAQLISKYGLHTVRIIGGVQALCAEHEIQLVEDTPQQRKAYLSYARTKIALPTAHDGNTKHDQRHEVDAMAHVIRYLFVRQLLTTLKVADDT